MSTGCIHHEAIQSQHNRNIMDHAEIWQAIDRLRDDIKHLIGKIGLMVGGITVLNSIAIILIQQFVRN